MAAVYTKKESDGIHIRSMLIAMVVMVLVMLVVTVLSARNVKARYIEMSKASAGYIHTRDLIDELQDASDYLTERARVFVMTGEINQARDYVKELKETRRRENSIKGLSEALENEYNVAMLLQKALDESNRLCVQELHAMALVASAKDYDPVLLPEEVTSVRLGEHEISMTPEEKQQKAMELVFGSNYMLSKIAITAMRKRASNEAQSETYAHHEESTRGLWIAITTQRTCVVLLVLGTIFICVFLYLLVARPIHGFVESIKRQEKIKVSGAYEFRYLARTYNRIYDLNMENKTELIYKAEHDPLTHLLNRGAFDSLCGYLSTYSNPLALLMIDIDKFKQVNDTYGHQEGDAVIKLVAKLLSKSFFNGDYIVRYGGDEFLVFMNNIDESKAGLVERKIHQINWSLAEKGREQNRSLSISAGVSFSSKGYTPRMLADADAALYFVKEHGRGGMTFFGEKMVYKNSLENFID